MKLGVAPRVLRQRETHPTETTYATVEKECLAVWGIRKFEVYLYGRSFVLETDHQRLQYLQSAKLTNGGLMRWAMLLQP